MGLHQKCENGKCKPCKLVKVKVANSFIEDSKLTAVLWGLCSKKIGTTKIEEVSYDLNVQAWKSDREIVVRYSFPENVANGVKDEIDTWVRKNYGSYAAMMREMNEYRIEKWIEEIRRKEEEKKKFLNKTAKC